ncbi:MAG: ORF6N domain-containing protein [bacterium]
MKEKQIEEVSLNISLIKDNIYIIRGQKVMLDRDLAILYEVQTMRLNQSVKRNLDRFPNDFMFELTREETDNWISQNVISNPSLKKSLRKPPLAFTEQGVAMLSGVLNSKLAIQVNIQIMRVFTRLREMVDDYKDLKQKVEEMELNNEADFKEIFRIIRLIITEKETPKEPIGFVVR